MNREKDKKSAWESHAWRVALFMGLAAACVVMQLMAVDYHFNTIVDYDWLRHVNLSTLTVLTANFLADAIVLLLPFLILPPRARKWGWCPLWVLTAWCLAQLLYMPTYRDFMPFSSFLLVENVGQTLWTSIVGALAISDLEVLLPPVILYLIYRKWFKQDLERVKITPLRRLIIAAIGIVAFLGIRLAVTAHHYRNDDETASFKEQIINDYAVMWTRQGDYINSNGVVPYAFHSAVTAIMSKASLSQEEKSQVEKFLKQQPAYTDNSLATARGKNVIMIVVESLNSWVVGLTIDGKEITPTLNALCADTTSCLVALNMKPQVKNGRSSDGIFMYNTGLLPLTTQAVANTHASTPYPALPKAFKGYNTFYACCDEPSLWNVTQMANTYGYHDFYGRAEIHEEVKRNGYKPDKALLEEVVQLASKGPAPFFALAATAGMHHPYNTPIEPATWIQKSGRYSKAVLCYLEQANVFDTALANLIGDLKDKGLYESTMLVILSDHNELVDDDRTKGRPTIDKAGDNCVLLFVNSGTHGMITGPVGQIDIYPTILDLMGLNAHEWKGLGRSLVRYDVRSAATDPATVAGNDALDNTRRQAWDISRLMITGNWFATTGK